MTDGHSAFVREAFARREAPVGALVDQAGDIAVICRELAARFGNGGRLFALGSGEAAADADHIAVEFIHPVIVGKPALPALAVELSASDLWRSGDMAIGVVRDGADDPTWAALGRAQDAGALAVVLSGSGGRAVAARHRIERCIAVDSDDPAIVKEAQVTIYHLLWEMVHVFLDVMGAGAEVADSALSGLYPFLYGGSDDADQVLASVTGSAATKVNEIVGLREQLAGDVAELITGCAARMAAAFRSGATLWTFGNGGSSTDAHAMAARFCAGRDGRRALPARCLTEEPAVLTALTNDVGFEVIFARQLKALGRPGDIAVGLSTSGGSANVLAGFDQAKKVGMTTVGFAGYDGGTMAELASLDVLFPVKSSSVHRIQELQTTLYGVLHEATLEALAG